MVCHQLRDFAAAEESYRRILDCRTREPYLGSVDTGIAGFKTRHNLAMLYLDAGRPQDAEAQLRQAVTEEPAFVPSWFALADLLRGAGRGAELDALVDQPPSRLHGVGLLVRARLLLDAGHDVEALSSAGAALATDLGPNGLHARRIQALALVRLGRIEEALPLLREVARLAPDGEEAHANLVQALRALGDHRLAVEACESGLALCPGSRRLQTLLADVLGSAPEGPAQG